MRLPTFLWKYLEQEDLHVCMYAYAMPCAGTLTHSDLPVSSTQSKNIGHIRLVLPMRKAAVDIVFGGGLGRGLRTDTPSAMMLSLYHRGRK